MIIVLVGESASGKTTLANMLEKEYGYERVVTYTTRPKREGERDGIDYHFITPEKYKEYVAEDKFLEHAYYRGWGYGTLKFNFLSSDNKVLVLTPAGARALKRLIDSHYNRTRNLWVKKNFMIIYLNVDRYSRLIKLLERGDDIDEAYRRNLSDVGQFDCFEEEADYVIDNAGYHKSPQEVFEALKYTIKAREFDLQQLDNHSPV